MCWSFVTCSMMVWRFPCSAASDAAGDRYRCDAGCAGRMLLLRKMPLQSVHLGPGAGRRRWQPDRPCAQRRGGGLHQLLFIGFPVFNFADVCICVGVGLLVLACCWICAANKKQNSKRGVRPQMEQRELTVAPGEALACGWTAGWRSSARPFPQPAAKPDRSGQCDLQRQPLEQKG